MPTEAKALRLEVLSGISGRHTYTVTLGKEPPAAPLDGSLAIVDVLKRGGYIVRLIEEVTTTAVTERSTVL